MTEIWQSDITKFMRFVQDRYGWISIINAFICSNESFVHQHKSTWCKLVEGIGRIHGKKTWVTRNNTCHQNPSVFSKHDSIIPHVESSCTSSPKTFCWALLLLAWPSHSRQQLPDDMFPTKFRELEDTEKQSIDEGWRFFFSFGKLTKDGVGSNGGIIWRARALLLCSGEFYIFSFLHSHPQGKFPSFAPIFKGPGRWATGSQVQPWPRADLTTVHGKLIWRLGQV